MTSRKFALDISWAFLGQYIALAIGIILNIIIGRFLGASSYGLYAIVLTIYTITSFIAGLGMPVAMVKYVAEFANDKEKISIFVSCGIINSFIFGAIAGLILFSLSEIIASYFRMPDLSDLIKILSISLPFLAINNILLCLLNGLREMKSYSLRTVIRSLSLLIFTAFLLYIGLGIRGAVFAQLATEIVISILLVSISRDLFNFTIKEYTITSKKLIKLACQLFLASAIWLANTSMDKVLIGYYLTDKDVGIYAIALAISNISLTIPGVISTVTYPMMSEYHGKRMHDANKLLIGNVMDFTLIILSLLGILIIFIAPEIILKLLRAEFLPAIAPLSILVLGMVLYGSMSAVGSAFSAINRPDISFKSNLIALVTNVILDIALIPRLGIIGAAIGTAVSLSVLTILCIYLLGKHLYVRIDINYYAQVLFPIAFLTAIIFIFPNWNNYRILAGFIFLIYFLVLAKIHIGIEEQYELKSLIFSIIKNLKSH